MRNTHTIHKHKLTHKSQIYIHKYTNTDLRNTLKIYKDKFIHTFKFKINLLTHRSMKTKILEILATCILLAYSQCLHYIQILENRNLK